MYRFFAIEKKKLKIISILTKEVEPLLQDVFKSKGTTFGHTFLIIFVQKRMKQVNVII